MITAIDTNILLDLRIPGAPHGDQAEQALTMAARAGALVLGEPVYAELAASVGDREDLDHFLDDTGIRLQPSGAEALHLAGRAWREYRDRRPRGVACPQCGASQDVRCAQCGRSLAARQHVLADFLIGAHALVHADRLLTRDRGLYSTYFPRLILVQ